MVRPHELCECFGAPVVAWTSHCSGAANFTNVSSTEEFFEQTLFEITGKNLLLWPPRK